MVKSDAEVFIDSGNCLECLNFIYQTYKAEKLNFNLQCKIVNFKRINTIHKFIFVKEIAMNGPFFNYFDLSREILACFCW